MKSYFKPIALVLLLSTANTINAQWWGKKIMGNGKVVTETRSTQNYNQISCAGSFDYILVAGKEGNISIKAEENLIPYIITETKGDKLIIRTENNTSISTKKGIVITIPFETIDGVSLSGSGDLWNEDLITASTFDVTLSGSGDVKLDLKTDQIESTLTGSGDIFLSGSTKALTTSVTGSGDFDGASLMSNTTSVTVTGSGDATVTSTDALKARVTGSGDITYKGNPKTEDTKVTGSGSISNY